MSVEYRRFSHDDVRSGMVVRIIREEDNLHSFDHTIVVKVDEDVVFLERPYMNVVQVDTLCPHSAISVERYSVSLDRFCELFECLWTNSSSPTFHGFNYRTARGY